MVSLNPNNLFLLTAYGKYLMEVTNDDRSKYLEQAKVILKSNKEEVEG